MRTAITLTLLFFFALPIGIIAYAVLGGVLGASAILLVLGCVQYPLLRYVARRLNASDNTLAGD